MTNATLEVRLGKQSHLRITRSVGKRCYRIVSVAHGTWHVAHAQGTCYSRTCARFCLVNTRFWRWDPRLDLSFRSKILIFSHSMAFGITAFSNLAPCRLSPRPSPTVSCCTFFLFRFFHSSISLNLQLSFIANFCATTWTASSLPSYA